jgi:chaperonin GroEL
MRPWRMGCGGARGGVALARCVAVLDKLTEGDPDEQIGINIVKRALQEPLRQIVENAGQEGAAFAF